MEVALHIMVQQPVYQDAVNHSQEPLAGAPPMHGYCTSSLSYTGCVYSSSSQVEEVEEEEKRGRVRL